MGMKCNCMINMCLLKYDSPDVICAAKVGQKLSGHVSCSESRFGKGLMAADVLYSMVLRNHDAALREKMQNNRCDFP